MVRLTRAEEVMMIEVGRVSGLADDEDAVPVAPARDTNAAVDRWLADSFHGPNHMKNLDDPYSYIKQTAEELKRRLAGGEEFKS